MTQYKFLSAVAIIIITDEGEFGVVDVVFHGGVLFDTVHLIISKVTDFGFDRSITTNDKKFIFNNDHSMAIARII